MEGFGHPPTTAFWFLPLAYFEKALAAEFLGISACNCLAWSLYICARELEVKAPVLWSVLLFSWTMTTQGMLMHWDAVQLSAHIALSLTLFWMYLRRGRDVAAGVMLGIALSLKLFPGVLALMLLFGGRFRALVACATVFSLISLVMCSGFGFDAWPQFFAQQPAIAGPWIGSIRNASLQGLILRALVPVCVMPAPSSQLGSMIATGISVVLLGASWLASRHALAMARRLDPRAIDLPFALFSVLAVFVNAWTWEHYSLLIITPCYIVVVNCWRALEDTYSAWLEELVATKRLILDSLILVLSVASVLGVMKMFAMDIHVKAFLADHYRRTHLSGLHFYAHLFEVISWLPWALMLVVCLGLAWHRDGPRQSRIT